METSYQKTARNTVIIGVTTLLQFLIGLIQLPLLTKTLGAHDYGVWVQVYATISLIAPFTNLGVGAGMVRFLAAEKNKEEIQEGFYSVISMLFLTNLIVSLLMIVFVYPLAMNFFGGAVQIVRITAILVLLIPVTSHYLELFRIFQQIGKYCTFLIIESCSQIGLIAYLVLNGYGILSVVLSILAIKVALFLVLFFLIKSQIGIKRPHFGRIKQYLSFGLPLVPRGIGFWLINLSDRYVIGFFLGVTAVGIYAAGYGIGMLPFTVVSVLILALEPALSKLYDEGRMNEIKNHLSYSLKYFLAIIIPFNFGAAILAGPVLRLFSTSEIASQGHFIVPVIALAVSFLGIHHIISFILFLAKKTKIMAPIWVGAAGLNLGLNMLVVPRIGILGAAITTLIAYSLALGMVSYYSFKEFRFGIDWRFIMKSLIASAVMSLAIWLMAPQANLDTILTVVAGVIIYGAILLLLRGFNREEIRFLRMLLRRGVVTANPEEKRRQ